MPRNMYFPRRLETPQYYPDLNKKEDQSDVKNYRFISLHSIPSKILEAIVCKKIIDHLSPLISREQFGFMKNCSYQSQQLTSLSDIYHSVDCKTYTNVGYFDFKKAFDTVPHKELLMKLWSMGITGPLRMWFKEYLSNRKHFVSILTGRQGSPRQNTGPTTFFSICEGYSNNHQLLYSNHQLLYSNHQLLYSNHQLLYSNHQLLYSNHQLLYSNHQLLYSNHLLLYSNHLLLYSNLLLLYSNHQLLYSNHQLLYSNHLLLYSKHLLLYSNHLLLYSNHQLLYSILQYTYLQMTSILSSKFVKKITWMSVKSI